MSRRKSEFTPSDESANSSHLPNPVQELERACAMIAKGLKADRRGRPEVLNMQLHLLMMLTVRLNALMPQIRAWDREQAAREAGQS